MNRKLQILTLSLVLLNLSACNKKTEESSTSVDPTEAAVETGINMISGMSDDQTGAIVAFRSEVDKVSIWSMLLGSQAQADTCPRAYYASCSNGIKSANYNGCTGSSGLISLSGSVNLNYSHMSCTLASNGDSVTRTYDLKFVGPRGGNVSHSSSTASDYRGTSYGGGGKITQTALGWDMDILGRHTSFVSGRGKELFNVSVRTLSSLKLTGSLSRSGRSVNSGQLEVNHNLAGFTAVLTMANLQWSSACCHPTSGTINIAYSGSKTGSAVLTFGSCGSASIVQNGQSQSVALNYCE